MTERYPNGTPVEGEVIDVSLLGVKVRLDDGQLGFIRRRELSWDQVVRHPDQFVKVGERLMTIVIARDDGYDRLALSLRQAQFDPWGTFTQAHAVGQVVCGVVTSLAEYGAFVEIARGVQGLVHISEIAGEWVAQVDDYLLRGDHVEAMITHIDHEKKQVSLSIKARLQRLDRVTSADLNRRQLAEKVMEHLHTRQSADEARAGFSTKPKHILIVDDDDPSRESLGGLLTRHGHHVLQARDGVSALDLVQSSHDVIFMDVEMPGVDGIETTRRVRARFPEVPVVIITSINWAEERQADLEALAPVDVLLKPLNIDEVLAVIEGMTKSRRALPVDIETELVFFQRLSTSTIEHEAPGDSLTAFAHQLRLELEAEVALIVKRDRISGEFAIAAYDSRGPLDLETVRHQLAHSPVRDVVEDEVPLLEDQTAARPNRGRFNKLLPLIVDGEFNSFIGVPVKVFEEAAYGLFLFHLEAGHFTRRHFRRVLAASIVLGAQIERRETLRQLQQSRQFVLAGQLSASLIHEINNRLSTLGTDIRSLQLDLKQWESASGKRPQPSFGGQVERLVNTSAEVIKTAQTFQRLIKADRLDTVDVNQILRNAYHILRHETHRAGVLLELELDPKLPRVLSSDVRLSQVFVNVMLNAIQQCRRGATVMVRTLFEAEASRPLRIRVADNGPGIHRRDFERIFEFGFTTRQDGSGMGLFISRGLLESLNGHIQVESSYLLVGTTFLIELPAEAAGHEDGHHARA